MKTVGYKKALQYNEMIIGYKKFLATKKGIDFVNKLHKDNICNLYKYFEVPKNLRISNSRIAYNIIYSVLENLGKANKVYKIGGKYQFTLIREPVQINQNTYIKRDKFPIRLSKEELFKIENRRPKKVGIAGFLHAYEEHKMTRFIKKHPAPTERELKEDLFPEELKAGYKNMLYIHREYIRDFLSNIYCKKINKKPYYRVFTVLQNKSATSEVEIDNEYGFRSFDEDTSIDVLKERLKKTAKTAHERDSNAIEVKLYSKYGNPVVSVKCAA